LPGLGTWRLGGRDVRPDRVVCWAGSCSPSLQESLPTSLDEVLGSGLALAERLGAMTGMGSRGRCTRQICTRTRPKPAPPLRERERDTQGRLATRLLQRLGEFGRGRQHGLELRVQRRQRLRKGLAQADVL
jgi:hypothetical protein